MPSCQVFWGGETGDRGRRDWAIPVAREDGPHTLRLVLALLIKECR
jgi:hypothetical protein